ncbi:MAG: hypothetical protein WCF84_01185 [Anaerolineae bacterium]
MENPPVQPPPVRHIWQPVRQNDADTHLLGLIATYGATVIIVRTYLELSGYPQVGDSTFHIAHLLWGGLFMFAALIMVLIWANPWLSGLTMVMGGIGAGLFIDEVGKFITQKNDYFFPLAFPIIYAVTLVGVWLYFRIRRSEPRDARTLLYHATHFLKKVLDNDLDTVEFQELTQTLEQAITVAEDPEEKALAQHLLDFVHSRDLRVKANPDWQERVEMRARAWLSEHPSRIELKGLLTLGLLVVAFLALVKLSGLVIAASSAPFDLRTLFSNYVIVNGKARYVVDQPLLLGLQSIAVVATGALSLVSLGLMWAGHERRGLRIGVLGLVLALTVVNLITFYFNQLYTMVDALVQLATLGVAQLYRWRFILGQAGPSVTLKTNPPTAVQAAVDPDGFG